MKHAVYLYAAATLAAAFGQPALADDSAKQTFELRGVVPLVCNATYAPQVAVQADGTIVLGTVREFCNAASGYRIVAEYAAGADPGTLIVDDRPVVLSASGVTQIGESSGPAIAMQQISYQPGTTPISSFRVKVEADTL